MTDIDHLSYSSIRAYLECSKAWKYQYVDKAETMASPALFFGSAIHAVVEAYVVDNSVALLGKWSEAWQYQLNNLAEKNKQINWGASLPEEYYNDGVRILSEPSILEAMGGIKVKKKSDAGYFIEEKITLLVPDVPVPITGFIDLISEDGVPGDIKTSSKSWSDDQAQGEMQPLFYLAALNQAGIETPGYKFRHYVFVKTKTPKIQIIEHYHNITEMFFLFSMIANVWTGISQEVFFENPNSWKCNPRWCDYWHKCRGRYS